jgi:hypothetical protein
MSFKAFNENAVYSLLYIMQHNVWFIVIAAAAIASIFMMLKEALDYSVNEEQNII